MAGYSATPLARKLGIQRGHRLALLDAPPDFEDALDALPDDVEPERYRGDAFAAVDVDGVPEATPSRADRTAAFDVIVAFTDAAQALEANFEAWAARLVPNGGLWVAWPKRASGVPTDLDENVIRAIGLAGGLVDNKVCAIDATWSGLRFVYRLSDRPKR
ncbi:MAG: DUF3052 domain-containing protein [Ardenticatenales bacterium]